MIVLVPVLVLVLFRMTQGSVTSFGFSGVVQTYAVPIGAIQLDFTVVAGAGGDDPSVCSGGKVDSVVICFLK